MRKNSTQGSVSPIPIVFEKKKTNQVYMKLQNPIYGD